MNTGTKLAAMNKFRSSSTGMMRQPMIKVLVVYDVIVKSGDVPQVPLIINYGDYASSILPIICADLHTT